MSINKQIPSRTIKSDNSNVLEGTFKETIANNNQKFLFFETLEEAEKSYNILKSNNIRCKYVKYSLFIKSSLEITLDKARELILKLVPTTNISYLRVDNNKHTGKVEIDSFEDYLTLKSSELETKFFHFDSNRIRINSRTKKVRNPN